MERKNNTDRQLLTKQEARSLMKQKRALLSKKEREEKNQIIFERLFAEDIWEGLDWFYPFVSYGTEVDTIAMIRHVLEKRTMCEAPRVAVPRVRERDMDFYEITSMEDLEPGYQGILEPGAACHRVTADEGLMLLPGLAFDKARHRVGYGGGYYDRYLAKHGTSALVTWAVAYDFQVVEHIQAEDFDVSPQKIIVG